MPWAKDLSFEEFCEYLLPYRIGTEVLEDWQEDLGGHFEAILRFIYPFTTEMINPDTVGYNYQTISVQNGRKYRYIRYLPKQETSGDIAEIEIYDKEGKLNINKWGNYRCLQLYKRYDSWNGKSF